MGKIKVRHNLRDTYSETLKPQLRWFENLIENAPAEDRQKIVHLVMKNLYDSKTKADQELYEEIQAGKYKLIGICPRISYALVEGNKEDLDAEWLHPFGVFTLLFKHGSSGHLIIVNPALRLDDSVINQTSGNKKYGVRGITG